MKKRAVKKSLVVKAPIKNENSERLLIENFTMLQRVLVELSGKISKLTEQTSNLLNLFEGAAKSLAERDLRENPETGRILQGIRELSEQNKILAKGLTLMHEKPQMQEMRRTPEIIPGSSKISSFEVDESNNLSRKLKPLPK